MGNVRYESLLHPGEFFQLGDLRVDTFGHGVEGASQLIQIVVTPNGQTLIQVTRRQPFGGLSCRANRHDDLPGHNPCDHAQESDQHESRSQDRTTYKVECLLLLTERK